MIEMSGKRIDPNTTQKVNVGDKKPAVPQIPDGVRKSTNDFFQRMRNRPEVDELLKKLSDH